MKTKEDYLIAKGLTTSNSFERFFMNDVLQAMQEYADQSKWVSVEEPPTHEKKVLIYTSIRDFENDDHVCKGWYDLNHQLWFSSEAHEDEEFDVTHWRELPSGPQS